MRNKSYEQKKRPAKKCFLVGLFFVVCSTHIFLVRSANGRPPAVSLRSLKSRPMVALFFCGASKRLIQKNIIFAVKGVLVCHK